jgi:hypothetical protein
MKKLLVVFAILLLTCGVVQAADQVQLIVNGVTVYQSGTTSSTFTVTGAASPTAGGSVSCNPSSVTSGSTTTCAITTNSGYTLTGASSNTCGGNLSGSTFNTGLVTSDCIVTATFSGGNTACGDNSFNADWIPFKIVENFPPHLSDAIQASGDSGAAVRFKAGPYTYTPFGVKMQVFDQTGQTLLKDVVVSSCPHSFTPVGGQENCSAPGVASTGTIYMRFGPAGTSSAWYDCVLTPGTYYYINFRDSSRRGGTVQTQFNATARPNNNY